MRLEITRQEMEATTRIEPGKWFIAYGAIGDRKVIRKRIERAPLRVRRRPWQRKTGTGAPLLSDDQEIIVRTLERVRSVLRDHAAGHHDAAWVVERLQAIVNRSQIEAALDRFDRRRVLRLVD